MLRENTIAAKALFSLVRMPQRQHGSRKAIEHWRGPRSSPLDQYCSLNDPDRLFEVDRRQRLGIPGTKWEIAHLAFHASQVSPSAAWDYPLLENLVEHHPMK